MKVINSSGLIIALLISATTGCRGRDVERLRIQLPGRGLCAHRGVMDTHPENTLAAFREAIRVGAHMIEFDVRLTKDKQLILMHDPSVDRTTNGKGLVSELTLKQIKRLDAGGWKGPEFEGQRVPTLKETLAMMPANTWLNVNLKGGREVGEKSARMIAKKNRLYQAFLACDTEAAEGARAVEPNILICNMERRPNVSQYVNETIAMKANFIQLTGEVGPELREHTKRLKENGVRINYFGTDCPQTLRKLFEMGVDFPLVNKIGSSMKVAEELGIQPPKPVFLKPGAF